MEPRLFEAGAFSFLMIARTGPDEFSTH